MIRHLALVSFMVKLAVALGPQQLSAQQPTEPFSRLSKLDLGEQSEVILIYYNPAFTTIIKQEVEGAGNPGTIRAIETKIDGTARDIHVIDYDPGPSGDPHFVIYRKDIGALVQIASINGTECAVPGDGSLYVSGEADDFFNKRRKYLLKPGMLKEVVQPFYYVGLTTTNRVPLKLYSA